MSFKEIFTKYKLYTMLSIIILVLLTGGIILGVSLSNTPPTTNALTSGNYTYTVSGNNATITDYTGTETILEIPGTLGGYTVTSIGTYAFYHCTSLTSVTIPNSVTSIGSYAFAGCTSLTLVTIGDGVNSIATFAFDGCTSLTSFTVDSNNQTYHSIDGVIYSKDGSTIVMYPGGRSGSYSIIEGTTNMGNSVFVRCTGLTSITIPSSVTSIGSYAFAGCTSLTSITIPSSVTSIGEEAFSRCGNLTSVSIGNGVTSIGNYAFRYIDNLTSVYFYNDLTTTSSIGYSAFANGNSNVAYYFKDQASLDYATNNFSSRFTNSSSGSPNFQLMTLDTNIIVQSNNTNWGTVSDNSGMYMKGSSIVISATPAGDNDFLGWSLDGGASIIDGTENQTSYVVNIAENATYTAVFEALPSNIAVNSNNNLWGTASGGGELSGTATLTATANPNYQLVGWSLDGGHTLLGDSLGKTEYTIMVTQDATYTAVFEPVVTITSLNGGSEFTITRGSADNVAHSYVIQMNSGYYINGIYITNTATPPATDSFTNIKSIDGYLPNEYSTAIHYITNTTGTQLILEIYNTAEPFTIYLDFVQTAQNFKASGSIEGIAVSIQYQGDETNLAVAGSAKILGYTTTNGLETVNVIAQEYTGYTFLGWQVDGEYITYQNESGQTITLQGYDYISASIPLSVIEGKQVIAVFTSTAELNANDQTNSDNSGVL